MASAVAILLAMTAFCTVAAARLRLPTAPLLLTAGLAYGAATMGGIALPRLPYDSDVVFALFFPVMLFAAGYEMPWNDLRANLGRNVLLSLSTVVAATLAVGALGHTGLGLPLVAALLLGVCLADPDFGWFLARADERNTGRPLRRAVAGEGLIEGTAMLVLFTAFSDASERGAIDWLRASRDLLVGSAWGALVGFAVAFACRPAFARLRDGRVAVVLSLALPFLAYLPAQATGGVRLAAVAAAGLVAGHALDPAMSAAARLTGRGAWGVLRVVVPGLIYIPAGAGMASVVAHLGGHVGSLAFWGLALAAASVAARFAWVGAVFALFRALGRDLGPWRDFAMGLLAAQRGAFAVASALALPSAVALSVDRDTRSWMIAAVLATVAASQLLQPALIAWTLARWPVPGDGREAHERRMAADAIAGKPLPEARDGLMSLRNADAISADTFREQQVRLDHVEVSRSPPEG